MKRSEFEVELRAVRDAVVGGFHGAADSACNRLLTWFDEVQRELGYVHALRSNLAATIAEKVELEVEVETLKARLDAKGRKSGKRLEEDEYE